MLKNKIISISGRKIGVGFSPYIIAEMSANHNGDINNAYKIIEMAKNSGADAVKFQTFKASSLVVKETKKANYQRTQFNEESQYEMLKKRLLMATKIFIFTSI